MTEDIEIFTGDVNDVEARVFARYVGRENEGVELHGTLRGPYCQGSHTLPVAISFRGKGAPGLAEAVVPDPCTWTPELPHVYRVDIQAIVNEQPVAVYQGTIGLRRSNANRTEP